MNIKLYFLKFIGSDVNICMGHTYVNYIKINYLCMLKFLKMEYNYATILKVYVCVHSFGKWNNSFD